jgi:tetratricopeptide (TPR) repeat protein
VTSAARDELLAKLESEEDPSEVLLQLTVDRLRAVYPEIGDVVRLAAIPRRIDPAIVGVLRGDADDDRDREIFDVLASLSFARPLGDGMIAYQDGIRDSLLKRYRTDPDLHQPFKAATIRLLEHYSNIHDSSTEAHDDLRRVTHVLRRANRERLIQIAKASEDVFIPSALEALYHAALYDTNTGFALFERLFDIHAEAERFAVCRAIRVAMQTYLEQLAPDSLETRQSSLLFAQGRIEASVDELDKAEASFRSAFEAAAEPTDRIRTLGALADLLQRRSRLGESLEARRNQVQEAESLGSTPTDLAVAYISIAWVGVRLGDMAEAERGAEKLSQLGLSEANQAWVATGSAVLGIIYFALGRLDEAQESILRAFDIARLDVVTGRATLASMTLALEMLLRLDRPRLIETLRAERAELAAAPDEPRHPNEEMADDIINLLSSWLTGRAESVLAQLLERTDETPTEAVATLLARARLRGAQGRVAEAAALCDRVIALEPTGTATPEQVAEALRMRSAWRVLLGRRREAKVDADDAYARWKRIGNQPTAALSRAQLAEIVLDDGDPDAAQHILNEIATEIGEVPGNQAELHRIQARIHRLTGRTTEARDAAEAAAKSLDAVGDLDRLAEALRVVYEIASDMSDWQTGTSTAVRMAEVTAGLAMRAAYQPTDGNIEADQRNAKGSRVYYGLEPTVESPLLSAISAFRGCVEIEPDNVLYRLNLAYGLMVASQFMEAEQQLDAVARQTSVIAQSSVFEGRAILCLVSAAQEERASGDRSAAMRLFQEASERARISGRSGMLGAILLLIAETALPADIELALGSYAEAVTIGVDRKDPALAARAVAKSAAVRTVQHATDATLDDFRQAILWYRGAGDQTAYWSIVRDCSELGIPYVDDPRLRGLLARLRDDPAAEAAMERFVPTLSAGIPTGWSVKESLTLLAPDGQANVIASSEPLDPSMTTTEYADIQGEVLQKEFPGYREHGRHVSQVLGRGEGIIRQFSWDPPDGDRVMQLQLYFVEMGRGYTATATTPNSSFSALEIQLSEVLASLIIRRATPTQT